MWKGVRNLAWPGRARHVVVCASLLASATLVAVPHVASAETAGTCAFGPLLGNLNVQFTPGLVLSANLQAVDLTISGEGTCAGNAGTSHVTVNLNGSGNLSCAGGQAVLIGSMSWDTGLPGAQPNLTATLVAGPASLSVVADTLGFEAVATLAWDLTKLPGCGGSPGVSNVALTGQMDFNSSI